MTLGNITLGSDISQKDKAWDEPRGEIRIRFPNSAKGSMWADPEDKDPRVLSAVKINRIPHLRRMTKSDRYSQELSEIEDVVYYYDKLCYVDRLVPLEWSDGIIQKLSGCKNVVKKDIKWIIQSQKQGEWATFDVGNTVWLVLKKMPGNWDLWFKDIRSGKLVTHVIFYDKTAMNEIMARSGEQDKRQKDEENEKARKEREKGRDIIR
jgi:hypothetical protein